MTRSVLICRLRNVRMCFFSPSAALVFSCGQRIDVECMVAIEPSAELGFPSITLANSCLTVIKTEGECGGAECAKLRLHSGWRHTSGGSQLPPMTTHQ